MPLYFHYTASSREKQELPAFYRLLGGRLPRWGAPERPLGALRLGGGEGRFCGGLAGPL